MRGEIDLRCGAQWSDVESTQTVRFFGELLGVVEVYRTNDWVERCVLYRADDGRVVIHHMRLSYDKDSADIAEAYILPPLDPANEYTASEE
jgi:hypothetical protein